MRKSHKWRGKARKGFNVKMRENMYWNLAIAATWYNNCLTWGRITVDCLYINWVGAYCWHCETLILLKRINHKLWYFKNFHVYLGPVQEKWCTKKNFWKSPGKTTRGWIDLGEKWPVTRKTYLGCQVVRVVLVNKLMWSQTMRFCD